MEWGRVQGNAWKSNARAGGSCGQSMLCLLEELHCKQFEVLNIIATPRGHVTKL